MLHSSSKKKTDKTEIGLLLVNRGKSQDLTRGITRAVLIWSERIRDDHEGTWLSTSFVFTTIFVAICIKVQYLYSSLINTSIVKTIDCLSDSSCRAVGFQSPENFPP